MKLSKLNMASELFYSFLEKYLSMMESKWPRSHIFKVFGINKMITSTTLLSKSTINKGIICVSPNTKVHNNTECILKIDNTQLSTRPT